MEWAPSVLVNSYVKILTSTPKKGIPDSLLISRELRVVYNHRWYRILQKWKSPPRKVYPKKLMNFSRNHSIHPDPYVHRQGCWLWPREDLETLDRGGIISSIRGGIWDASLSRTSFPMGFYCWNWRNQTDSPYKFEVGCPILTTWQAKTSRFWYLWISGWTILCR